MLTIRQLRYLDALVRCQHFGRAAEECAVSQPALSIGKIRELEEFLGIELFERRPWRAGPHRNRGSRSPSAPEAILSATRDLVDLAQHRSKLLSGTLLLGIIPTLAALFIAACFATASGRASRSEPRFTRNANQDIACRTDPRAHSTYC